MTRRTMTTAEELWEAAERRFPAFSVEEQRAGLALLEELARGEPVDATQAAQALRRPVEALLEKSGLTPFVHADEGGRALGFWGLSTVPTHHRFTLNGRALWTWCAVDSLFLPELLGMTARVRSKDPENGELVQLTVSPTGVLSTEPQGIFVSMSSPATWDTTSATRVIATACHFIFFFTSRASGERWLEKHPGTVLLPVDEAFRWGKLQNARAFGQELARRVGSILRRPEATPASVESRRATPHAESHGSIS